MLDLTKRYKVDRWGGIAWYVKGYATYRNDDYEWTGEEVTDYSHVIAIMVGDDTKHIIEVTDLTAIEDDEYCPECGQIGCTAVQ